MSAQGRFRVLLVEDNPRDAELTIRALRRSGLVEDVVHLKDGEQALDYLRHGQPDSLRAEGLRVILLDLKLPKVGGLELLHALKSVPGIHAMPIVVFTSSREDRDVEESYRLGVKSYIVKPAEYQRLEEVIQDTARYWLTINETPRASAEAVPGTTP